MVKPDLFGFDIRVSPEKKKRARARRSMSGAFVTSIQVCEHPGGCSEAGQYRAPKSPNHLDEYLWFCKGHVREYNLKWNFFSGTTKEEFKAEIDSDRGRGAGPSGKTTDEARAWQRLGIDDPHQVLGENATRNPGRSTAGTRKLPPTERRALDILEARDHWSKSKIRKEYKSLIRDLHPDMNGGNREDEYRLQEVVWAWAQIKESRNFQE